MTAIGAKRERTHGVRMSRKDQWGVVLTQIPEMHIVTQGARAPFAIRTENDVLQGAIFVAAEDTLMSVEHAAQIMELKVPKLGGSFFQVNPGLPRSAGS